MSVAKRIFCCMLLICTVITGTAFDNVKADEEESFSFSIPVAYDTYIRKGYGTNDYSNDTTMIADGRASSERIGVMRFRYGAGASDSAEAVRDTSSQITLKIRVNQNPGAPKLVLYGICDETMKSSWADGSMNYDLASKLGILKARGSEQVPVLAVYDMEGVSASDYLEFDVTDYVKQQMSAITENADGEFVFLICGMNAYSPSDYFRIYQDNGKGTTSADNIPVLIVSAGREGYLKKDTMALDIEKKHGITEDFVLPAVLGDNRADGYASTVEWRSDTESVIALEKNGDTYTASVNRPSSSKHGDAAVTLSAVIKNGSLSEVKSFKLYVLPEGVYNASLTNYIKSSSEETHPNEVIYSYVKSKTKYIGFVKFPFDANSFYYTPKAVLRLKPYFMQGAFTLTITAVDYKYINDCTEDMTWKGSQDIISDKGMYSVTINQNPSQTEWIEWDVTDYINSVGADAVFRLEIASSGTSYCMLYGNEEKYVPQLKLYNYELITDAETAVKSVAKKVQSELDMLGSSLGAVTGDIDLPCPENYGVTIDWYIFDENGNNSEYISEDGTLIKQPDDEDKTVRLRAVINRDDYTDGPIIIETDAKVLKQVSAEEAIKFNEENLVLNNNVLTNNGKLPRGFHGAEVVWSAEPQGYIEINGGNYTVLRRESDIPVTFTAKIKKEEASAEKSFDAVILRDSSKNLIYGLQVIGGDTDMENTNDDNVFTHYSQDSNFNIDYKLLSEKRAGSVVIVPYKSENIKNIGIYISKDGVIWEKVKDTAVHEGINDIAFPAEDILYLRLEVTVSGEAGICEAGVYTAEDDENTVTAEDIIGSAEFIKLSGIPSGLVKNDFKLQGTVKNAEVKWYSGNTAVISLSEVKDGYNASVKRADKTKGVKLKAVVSINGTTAEKEFSVSVSGTEQGISSSGGGGGGGSVSKPSLKPSVKPEVTLKPADKPKPTALPSYDNNAVIFKDIEQTPWAKKYITELCKRGIIDGRTENEFMPMENITREEFVKLIVLALELETGSGCEFSDVSDTEWYYPYICSAVKAGVVSGIGEGKFGTGNRITRQDMAVIVSLVLRDVSYGPKAVVFNDSDHISDYAVSAVEQLSGMDIMSGDERGNINPLSFATRAEASRVIYMMLEIIERN